MSQGEMHSTHWTCRQTRCVEIPYRMDLACITVAVSCEFPKGQGQLTLVGRGMSIYSGNLSNGVDNRPNDINSLIK